MWRRAAPAVLLAGLWLVATGPAAGAHAVLRGSDPAGGASVRRAPGTVTLRFSEAPDPGLSVVHVIDTSGREVSAGGTAPVGAGRRRPGRAVAAGRRRPLELLLGAGAAGRRGSHRPGRVRPAPAPASGPAARRRAGAGRRRAAGHGGRHLERRGRAAGAAAGIRHRPLAGGPRRRGRCAG